MRQSNHYLVILCGGTGPRLWPMSRASFPKPFLKFFGQKTLLQQTYQRALKVAPAANIIVLTNKNYQKLARQQLPNAKILTEPLKKNTARAILTITQYLQKVNPHAIISTLPSDHYVSDPTIFSQTLKRCYQQATNGYISLIGVKPDRPDISYGYLLTDGQAKVNQFVEKPDLNQARHLLYQPHTFWNSGVYTFSIDTMLSQFSKYEPSYLTTSYDNSLDLSIDVAISEKSDLLSYIPADFDWSDVGEWKTIYNLLPKDTKNNAVLNKSKYLNLNSSNCLISTDSKKLVGLVGVKDLAIIDTPDGLLVCSLRDDISFQVRDLVTQMVKDRKTEKYFTHHL